MINNDKKIAIKSTIKTQGWLYIQEILENKINSLRLSKNINKNKKFEDIAIETLSKAHSVRTLERFLKEINKISNEKKIEIKKPMI